jgi:hypothetical protein
MIPLLELARLPVTTADELPGFLLRYQPPAHNLARRKSAFVHRAVRRPKRDAGRDGEIAHSYPPRDCFRVHSVFSFTKKIARESEDPQAIAHAFFVNK